MLRTASKGRYGRAKAEEIKSLAQQSIGANSPAAALELQLTLQHLDFLQNQVNELDKAIRAAVVQTQSPILSIPGIGPTLAALSWQRSATFTASAPRTIQAFAGLDPSTYQFCKFKADKPPMVKHGSTYLRWALMQAARLAAVHCETFGRYLAAKQAQGKHYFVALGYTAKKLIRVIFRILSANEVFVPQT